MSSPASRFSVDKLGALASAVCAVHCLLTGVALGLFSVAGLGFVGSVVADAVFLLIAIAVGGTAIVHGARKHHSVVPALIFVVGLAMFVMGHFAFGHTHGESAWSWQRAAHVALSVGGGLCIVLFHVVNLRLQKSCGCNHCRTGS